MFKHSPISTRITKEKAKDDFKSQHNPLTQDLAKDNFYLGKVDAILEKELATKLDVIEYPSLQYYKF